jgi:hypothetical protein
VRQKKGPKFGGGDVRRLARTLRDLRPKKGANGGSWQGKVVGLIGRLKKSSARGQPVAAVNRLNSHPKKGHVVGVGGTGRVQTVSEKSAMERGVPEA